MKKTVLVFILVLTRFFIVKNAVYSQGTYNCYGLVDGQPCYTSDFCNPDCEPDPDYCSSFTHPNCPGEFIDCICPGTPTPTPLPTSTPGPSPTPSPDCDSAGDYCCCTGTIPPLSCGCDGGLVPSNPAPDYPEQCVCEESTGPTPTPDYCGGWNQPCCPPDNTCWQGVPTDVYDNGNLIGCVCYFESADIFCNAGGGEKSGVKTALGCIPTTARALGVWLTARGIIIAGGLAFLLMVFAGFQIITSSGDPKKLQSGQQLLTAAISGLLLIIFSIFVLRLIGVEILGIPGL